MAHHTPYRTLLRTLIFLIAAGPAHSALAQTQLLKADALTRVKGIHFAFLDAEAYPPRFHPEDLKAKIATKAPGWRFRLASIVGLQGKDAFLLDPVELQKDVVRLRALYREEGFLRPHVDYAASVLDIASNTVQIRFNITQGPPVIIQDVGFYTADGYLASVFASDMRARWIAFRDQTSFRTGDRFTAFGVVRIEDQVLGWLKDQGYAFATLYTVTDIDSTYNSADINFLVDPGPPGAITQIDIHGNQRVGDRVVRRELPFKEGDLFSNRKLMEGQRELFELNLFQVAQAEVPEQPRDSTVQVRIVLRESPLRYVSAEAGYDRTDGATLEGQWSHRNFFGGARTLTARGEVASGLLASAGHGTEPRRLFRASLALAQPYLLTNGLSGVIEPYAQFERDPLLRDTDLFFGVNRREYGLNSTVIYEILTVRAMSLRYRLGRAIQFADARDAARDAYNKGILTFSGALGWTDNLINPRRGVLARPFLEQGGGIERLLGFGATGLEYVKTGLEIVAYIPVTGRVNIGVRIGAGRLWPVGPSKGVVQLYAAGVDRTVGYDAQFVSPLEDRFDPVRFYAGGSNDVRGWGAGLIGPKINRTEFARDGDGAILYDGEAPRTHTNQFEPVGGLTRLLGNVEVRLPAPGLGRAWRAALFLDAGQISSRSSSEEGCAEYFFSDPGKEHPADVQCGFSDTGGLAWDRFKFGAGAGIRYETPIGRLRLDIAVKLNPDDLDLQTPRNAFLSAHQMATPERSLLQRFNIHVTLGQAF